MARDTRRVAAYESVPRGCVGGLHRERRRISRLSWIIIAMMVEGWTHSQVALLFMK